MKTEAETGVTQAQGKELMEPPDIGRSQEEFPPRAFRGEYYPINTLILDFWTLEL